MMQIGQVIRKYRKEKEMTQEEIRLFVKEADERLRRDGYEEALRWGRKAT